MHARCPSCNDSFEVTAEHRGRATLPCPRCGRVVVLGDAAAVVPASGGASLDPGTEPLIEPLSPAEDPTQIGVASQTLSLPPGKRVAVAILSGPRKGEVVTLARPSLTFGREGGGADLEVPDADVSRRHAALECHGPRIALRDLGSRNGTFVGDERLGSRDLEDQAEFRLGGTIFMLVLAEL